MKLRLISEAALNEVSLAQRMSQAISQKGREYDNAKVVTEKVKEQGALLQRALSSGKKMCKVILKGPKLAVQDSHGSLCAIKIEPGRGDKPQWSYRACGSEWGSGEKSEFDPEVISTKDMAALLVELVPSLRNGNAAVSEEYIVEGPVGNLFGKLAAAIARKNAKKAQDIKAGSDMGVLIADVKPLLMEVAAEVNSMAPGAKATFSSNTNGAFVEVKADYAFEIDASEPKAVVLTSAIEGQKVVCPSIEEAVRTVATAFKVTIKQSDAEESGEDFSDEDKETSEDSALSADQQKTLDALKEMGVDLSKIDTKALSRRLKAN